jgi:hypothetical protein
MAISVCYWANYVVANKAKISRKSKYAVDGDRVLKFFFDAAACLHYVPDEGRPVDSADTDTMIL